MKKLTALLLTGALAISVLTGCGNTTDTKDQAATDAATDATDEATDAADASDAEATDEATEEASDAAVESKGTITVAASATPHAEILEEAKPILAEQGTHLVNAGGIHYEPFGIYPGTKSSLDDLADGDVIAVPNDTTNEARALLLLEANGVITLKDGAGLAATVNDIAENPKNVEIKELEAAQVSRVKDEVAFVVLNGNYALQAGFSVAKDSIAYETSDSEAAKTYVNVIAVKEGNENNDAIKALVDVLKSDEIKQFINDKYDGAVIPFEE